MATIGLKLENQLLTIQNQEIIASGGSNIDKCEFTFSDEWGGFVKTAVFYQDKTHTHYAVLEADDTCMIPAEAMAKEGNLYIGVFGINSSKVLTSTIEKFYINEGAISGEEISTEPSDDVFLSIIAQYQKIVELMHQYEKTAEQFNENIQEQNKILESLNAFDVGEITERLNAIEERMVAYNNLAQSLIDREVILRDVPVKFVDGVCEIQNELITSESLCDVYFDEYSYELAAKSLITVSSYDGYVRITSSVNITEELNTNILVRGY